MTKRVEIGDAFESLEAQIDLVRENELTDAIEAKVNANESRTRSNLAYWAISGGALFLTASAGVGFYDGTFDEMQSVWNVFGPIVGAIFGHYFGGKETKNGSEKTND